MMQNIFEIASKISTPMALAGLFAAVLFFTIRKMLSVGVFPAISKAASGRIIKLIIDRLFILSLLAMLLGFIGYALSFYAPLPSPSLTPEKVSQVRYVNSLFECAQELRRNREHLAELRMFIDSKTLKQPVGQLSADKTLAFLGEFYDKAMKDSYGEEKYIYQLALRLQDASRLLGNLKGRANFAQWNNTYEMTVDDLSFLSGFLSWYFSHLASGQLTKTQVYSLGWGALSNVFEKEGSDIHMRYFVYEGKPILEYDEYLGLID